MSRVIITGTALTKNTPLEVLSLNRPESQRDILPEKAETVKNKLSHLLSPVDQELSLWPAG